MKSQWIVNPTPNAMIASKASNTSSNMAHHLLFCQTTSEDPVRLRGSRAERYVHRPGLAAASNGQDDLVARLPRVDQSLEIGRRAHGVAVNLRDHVPAGRVVSTADRRRPRGRLQAGSGGGAAGAHL